ncbi:MAG TPA: right-handed parallel beta-helix repeat-containing protein, partial [Verrucomicrobiae bacterium]|nr:right-handed parallel beta-helix repeat-containing protein [Verrucomicrobiae bacterium]
MERKMKIVESMKLLAIVVLGTTIMSAQATRTWVSGVGDDANPCSRTAP